LALDQTSWRAGDGAPWCPRAHQREIDLPPSLRARAFQGPGESPSFRAGQVPAMVLLPPADDSGKSRRSPTRFSQAGEAGRGNTAATRSSASHALCRRRGHPFLPAAGPRQQPASGGRVAFPAAKAASPNIRRRSNIACTSRWLRRVRAFRYGTGTRGGKLCWGPASDRTIGRPRWAARLGAPKF